MLSLHSLQAVRAIEDSHKLPAEVKLPTASTPPVASHLAIARTAQPRGAASAFKLYTQGFCMMIHSPSSERHLENQNLDCSPRKQTNTRTNIYTHPITHTHTQKPARTRARARTRKRTRYRSHYHCHSIAKTELHSSRKTASRQTARHKETHKKLIRLAAQHQLLHLHDHGA